MAACPEECSRCTASAQTRGIYPDMLAATGSFGAHLTFPSSVDRVFTGLDLPPEQHLLVAAHNARVLLDHGFTSAYSAGSRGQRFEVAIRDEINAGYSPDHA